MEATTSFMSHPWKSYSVISTVSYYYTGQASSTWEGMNTRKWGSLEAMSKAGYYGIKDEWNFPDGQGRRKASQAEEINIRTSKYDVHVQDIITGLGKIG